MIFPEGTTFCSATRADLDLILANQRELDRDSLAVFGLSPEGIAEGILAMSCPNVARLHGEPVLAYFYDLQDDRVLYGAIATPAIGRYGLSFTRGARAVLRVVREAFPDRTHLTVSQGPTTPWLRLLGFRETGEFFEGPNGRLEYMRLP